MTSTRAIRDKASTNSPMRMANPFPVPEGTMGEMNTARNFGIRLLQY